MDHNWYRVFISLRRKCPYSELFWSTFSLIWTEYGETRSNSPYSVQMRENTDQNNSEYGHIPRSVCVKCLENTSCRSKFKIESNNLVFLTWKMLQFLMFCSCLLVWLCLSNIYHIIYCLNLVLDFWQNPLQDRLKQPNKALYIEMLPMTNFIFTVIRTLCLLHP